MSESTTRTIHVDDEGSAIWLLRILKNAEGLTNLTLVFSPFFRWPYLLGKRAALLTLIYKALKVNQEIQELTLVHVDNLDTIDEILISNKTITRLVIHAVYHVGNKSRTPNFEPIRTLLQRGPQIELHFAQCHEFNAESFANAIPQNSTLSVLSLSDCLRYDRRVQEICKAIPRCSGLTKLELREYVLNENAAQTIGTMLEENSTLIEFILGHDDFGSVGIKYILNALLKNSTLKKLDLTDNPILDSDTGVCIAKVIRENSTLTDLCLDGNERIVHSDILDALQHNTTVTKLNFRIHSRVLKLSRRRWRQQQPSLESVIRYNTTLTEIAIDDNHYFKDEIENVVEALGGNQTLQVLDISNVSLSYRSIEVLGNALKINKMLKCLKVQTQWDRGPPC